MSTLGRYFHTLRYLRPRQVGARIWLRLYRPRADLSRAPGLRPVRGAYQQPVSGEPSLIGPSTFRLLNVERSCANAADWHPRDADKLWVYNLHYFDDLNARGAPSRAGWHWTLLERWATEIPAGYGDAWEPYPVSRRVVNWVKWSLCGNQLSPRLLDSLAAQTRWLMRRLEYHLLGNHLLANAKALLYAGLYFEGAEAETWRARALAILDRELPEQVLDDGGHFELSPMYHAATLEDVLDLINVKRAYGLVAPREWLDAAARMRRWLRVMSHPDGEISFFNDSAFGTAPTCDVLEQYAASLGLPGGDLAHDAMCVLGSSGYVRLCVGHAYLLCDCGAVGPTYLPGHAHADTLSFELSLHGRRVIVNSGTSQYGIGAERQRQRGTAAHNTVVVDGQDSSEVWAGFRVARRAHAVVHHTDAHGPLTVEGSHDGYRRLPGRNEHRRRWILREGNLRIEDRISGRFGAADAFFHLHPEVEATASSTSGTVALSRRGGLVAKMAFEGASAVEITGDSWHPGFGVAVANRCVRVRFASATLATNIDWAESR